MREDYWTRSRLRYKAVDISNVSIYLSFRPEFWRKGDIAIICEALRVYILVEVIFSRIILPIFPPSSHTTVVFLSCRPFVVNMTFSTGLVGVEVSSVSWLGQLTVGVQITDYCNCWFSKFLLLPGLGLWIVGVQITDWGKKFAHWVVLSCDDIIEQVFKSIDILILIVCNNFKISTLRNFTNPAVIPAEVNYRSIHIFIVFTYKHIGICFLN